MHHVRQQCEPGKGLEAPRLTADVIASEGGKIICLDEFQIIDIADAMIVSRLFARLFELGVTVIFTSNREPDKL